VSHAAVVDRIAEARRAAPADRSVLVAVTGIDGSGKGYVTAQIAAALQARGLHVANINIDGWLNLPQRRFSQANPARRLDHRLPP
jgi:uridine kinase